MGSGWDDIIDDRFEPDKMYTVAFDRESGRPLEPVQQMVAGLVPVGLRKLYEDRLWKRGLPKAVDLVRMSGIAHVKRAHELRRVVRVWRVRSKRREE